MIVNPGSSTVDMTNVYSLNETAAYIWRQMEGRPAFQAEDMAAALQAEYDIDEQTALSDCQELATTWLTAGLVSE